MKQARARVGKKRDDATAKVSKWSDVSLRTNEQLNASPEQVLVSSLRANYARLKELHRRVNDEWVYEDFVYRFYHQSYKVYGLQRVTLEITAALEGLLPAQALNASFLQIVKDGTGKKFEHEHNTRWLEVTRPIVEAFFHAKYFLDMAMRYGRKFKRAPQLLPSGWAGLLYLYDLR